MDRVPSHSGRIASNNITGSGHYDYFRRISATASFESTHVELAGALGQRKGWYTVQQRLGGLSWPMHDAKTKTCNCQNHATRDMAQLRHTINTWYCGDYRWWICMNCLLFEDFVLWWSIFDISGNSDSDIQDQRLSTHLKSIRNYTITQLCRSPMP